KKKTFTPTGSIYDLFFPSKKKHSTIFCGNRRWFDSSQPPLRCHSLSSAADLSPSDASRSGLRRARDSLRSTAPRCRCLRPSPRRSSASFPQPEWIQDKFETQPAPLRWPSPLLSFTGAGTSPPTKHRSSTLSLSRNGTADANGFCGS
uniref:Uncharacterized protein n=1 Tax=Aegilops tauschii subsp. strangulata TaxID=200361 RepID=A0A453GTG3_AEGTS